MQEIAYLTATDLAAKIKKGDLSSAETLDYFVNRMAQHNPPLNAIVATNIDAARKRAQAADAATAAGESWGPLHGVPMTIKDSFEVVGMPTTSGAQALRNYRPKTNADAVQKLHDAGVILWGKTNLPLYAGDVQSYNDVYGTTNNPWDTSRTPGGSSGGSAAALAAGLTPLELGSDIGGSIRTPAHYCGVYGHKPTFDIVSQRGHIPGPPGTLTTPDLAVTGPLARSAADLKLMLDIIAGPRAELAGGWRLKLPASRHRSLKRFKVGVWFDDPYCMIDYDMRGKLGGLVDALKEAGVEVVIQPPAGFSLEELVSVYLRLLGAVIGSGLPDNVRKSIQRLAPIANVAGRFMNLPDPAPDYLNAMVQSFRDWAGANEKRLQMRQKMVAYFEDVDVLLMPVSPVAAPSHNQKGEILQRKLTINGQERLYFEQLFWISLATIFNLPATSAPIGQTTSGLPINVQIVGGPYQDNTTIAFANHLTKLIGGFTPPPGYAS